MTTKKIIHGDDLLYRFFQDVLASKPELFAEVPQLLITTMGVWMPREVYRRWPIMLPWVVRDPKCRGNPKKGVPDAWSSADSRGYLRDDNSLVKSLPKSMPVRGPKGSHIDGAKMGTEFVASHVWRKVKHAELASRLPALNSFVPNLVWLPGQIAKLTDVEGGIVQRTLQAMSYAIYRAAPVEPHLASVAGDAWDLIPKPAQTIGTIDPQQLNWFQPTERFYRTRAARLASVINALELLTMSAELPERVVTRRYAKSLPSVPSDSRSALLARLRQFPGDDD